MKVGIGAAALMTLSACGVLSPGVPPAAGAGPRASIAISVGPCFGFCPVYDAKIAADGAVSFTGIRHTAAMGTRERQATPQAYRAIESDLAPFRPAGTGTAEIPCAAEISDMPTYTITWTDPAGEEAVATHRGGCREGRGQDLDAVLRGMPQRLGITEWMKQTSRPGVSRG